MFDELEERKREKGEGEEGESAVLRQGGEGLSLQLAVWAQVNT